jgi:hypothetical protein
MIIKRLVGGNDMMIDASIMDVMVMTRTTTYNLLGSKKTGLEIYQDEIF